MLVVFNFALSIAFVVGVIWALTALAELRRGQREIVEVLTNVARTLGLPTKPQTLVVLCGKCGAQYAADLTGCDICGQAKAKDAVQFVPSAIPGAASSSMPRG